MDSNLPLEILSLVLSHVDDLYTLSSAILTCRRIRDAFTSGPRSLLLAVVQNHLGDALMPLALRLALLQKTNRTQQEFPWEDLTEEGLANFPRSPFLLDAPAFLQMIAKSTVTMSYFVNFFSQMYV